MIERSRQRQRLHKKDEGFLDRLFSRLDNVAEKGRDENLSLLKKLTEFNPSKDITFNLVKMSNRDKIKFVLTKNLKSAHKLLTGKLNEEKMESMKLSSKDYIYYEIAQQNKGYITENAIREYAKDNYYSKNDQKQFINQAKMRFHSLRSAGCVNDLGKGKYEKIKVNIGDKDIKVYARKQIKYQVTHVFKKKLESLREEVKYYRLNNQEKMILDSFRHFGTRDEVIDHLSSFYSNNIETRENIMSAQIWKLERFGYLEKVGDTYFTNIDYEFTPNIDYFNKQILYLAKTNNLNEEELYKIYEKTTVEDDAISFVADSRVAQLKFKGYIDDDNRLTEEGKIAYEKAMEEIREKVNKKSSLTILELCVKDSFNRDEYNKLLEGLYDNNAIDKMMDRVEYTLSNLKMLNFIDEGEKITSDGLMFLERSKFVYGRSSDERTKIKEIGYFERQVLTEINKRSSDFSNITIGDLASHKVENICKTYTLDLYSKGYLNFENGEFKVTDKAKDLLYKENYSITNFDTKNILENSKEGFFSKEIFREYQLKLGKNEDQINKSFEMIEKRLETHIYNEMIIKSEDKYILTEDFIRACGKNPGTVTKEFSINDYDRNILKLIDKKVFSKEGVIKELRAIYGEDAERRYYIMRSRARALAKEGYVSINNKEFFSLTDEGKAILNDYKYELSYFDYKSFLETSIDNIFSKDFYKAYYLHRGFDGSELKKEEAKLNSRLELHINSGLVEKLDDDLYLITDKFWEKYREDYLRNKEFELGKFDKFILNRAKDRVIDVESYVNELKDMKLSDKQKYNKERMFKNRLLLLEREGYITKLDDNKFMLTDKHLVMRDKVTGERINIGQFDKRLYKKINDLGFNDGFTLDDLKILGHERDIKMFTGRCVKLHRSGYLVEINGKLHFNDRFIEEISNKKPVKKEIKINRFDVNKIYRCSIDGKFSREAFRNEYMGNEREFEKIFNRVEKRLLSLQEQGYVKNLGNGEYELRDKFLSKCREHEKKLLRMKKKDRLDLTQEQKFILTELQTFLNISQSQFNRYNDFSNELKSLYDRGAIEYEYRVINGERTKVFYLSSEGKQLVSKLTGVKVANIFSSKIHSRPQELEHDVLVYTAYQDAKIRLLSKGKTITELKSDRQMRSEDMSIRGQMRIELSDLEIEYEDVKTGEKGIVNIEVDLGYPKPVIESKSRNISNLVWYTNSDSQMTKIKSVNPKARVIML